MKPVLLKQPRDLIIEGSRKKGGSGEINMSLKKVIDSIKSSATLDDSIKQNMRIAWERYEKGEVDTAEVQATQGPTLRSATIYPCMAETFSNRMQQDFLTYGPQGWSSFYPLSSAGGYLDSYEQNNLCNLADSYGSPPQYTIVVLKQVDATQQVNPLLTTKWGQREPFNANLNDCSAGCATIAIAQTMKFFGKPTTYNWANMPDLAINTTASSSTADMINLIGNQMKLDYIDCYTGATDNDIKVALQFFNYNYTLSAHNDNTVRNWLFNEKKPIIMGGYTGNGDGHSWVCDGVKETVVKTYYFVEFISPNCTYSTQSYASDSYPREASSYTAVYFNMNWGDYGNNDGWYFSGSAYKGSYNFNTNRTNFYVSPK